MPLTFPQRPRRRPRVRRRPAASNAPDAGSGLAVCRPATGGQPVPTAGAGAKAGGVAAACPGANPRSAAAALPQPQPQPQAQSPTPAYLPPQPDISVKYHVLLGLPQDRPGDGFDAPATELADVGSSPIAEFRRHLKTCATLPKEVAASDKVAIKLRVQMTPDGRLAAEPLLIEASASMKGPLLMQSAISALRSCQPYAMLPADKYNEWKVLDLSFTPQDFGGAS